MRIAIDARVLGSHAGGDESYVRNLVQALGAVDRDNEYTLLVGSRAHDDRVAGAQSMRRVAVQPHAGRVPNPLSMPLALARARPDVAHALYMAPWLYPVQIVVTVLDIAYERFPTLFEPAMVAGFRKLVPWTIRRAASVVTCSEFSRRDLMQYYSVPPDKVVVAPLAAAPHFRLLHDEMRMCAVRERFNTGSHFILSLGNLQPRKNLRRLIEAYVRLRRADTTRHRLVIVGKQAWLYDDTFAAARASGFADDLIFTGYVSDDDAVALYNAAELFVYPSIFEGFGLPPLEAMACGTPVISSNTSSLPEVVGDAAISVDPLDAEGLACAMAAVLNDPELRARLSLAGIKRAAMFSWLETARITMGTYRARRR